MSSIQQKKLEELSASLGMVFKAGRIIIDFGNNSILPSRNVNNNMVLMKESEKTTSTSFDDVGTYLSKTYKHALSMFQTEIQTHKMRVLMERRGIIIQLGADMFFEPGSAVVNPTAEAILKKLSLLLAEIPNKIRIEGHTDNRPVVADRYGHKFESNWELSAQRAINIIKYYEALGIPESRMMAVAYSDTKPLVPNDTPEGRAYNRRVDIVIIDRESQE
jgi:chemotaxis protein MotB